MNEQELMRTSILGCERSDLYIEPKPFAPDQAQLLAQMQQRRKAGEPLQYILGSARFLEFDLKVNGDVLIPRPETELLVDALIREAGKFQKPALNVLDLGTGSGNIAISLGRYFPDSTITAIDISAPALVVAKENAKACQVDRRIMFKQQCLREFLNHGFADDEKFDIIVSNPPYISAVGMQALPQDVRREPEMALAGGEDGLKFLKPIIQKAPLALKPNGILALEFGDGQRPALEDIFRQTDSYTRIDFGRDCTLTDRYVIAKMGSDTSN